MTHIIDNQIVEGLLEHKSLRFNAIIRATAAGTISLTSTNEYLNIFTGTTAGQIIKLPDATTVSNGHSFQVWNNSTSQITINDNGNVTIVAINPGQRSTFILQDNTTSSGIWVKEVTTGSAFTGTTPVACSYTASAGVGRYLEFYPSNASNLGPFLVIANATIIALAIVANASTTGTVSIFKTSDLVNPITSISITAQSTNSILGLNVPIAAGDALAVRVTSGSIQKPGLSIYLAGA
jgi:hypothetical protein